MKSRDSLKTLLIAGAVFFLPAVFYSLAYFACTARMGGVPATGGSCRVYRSSWEAVMFLPAAFVESAATGRNVTTAFKSPSP